MEAPIGIHNFFGLHKLDNSTLSNSDVQGTFWNKSLVYDHMQIMEGGNTHEQLKLSPNLNFPDILSLFQLQCCVLMHEKITL